MFHVVPAVGLSENDAVVEVGLVLAGLAALARGAGRMSCDRARRSSPKAGEARAAMKNVNFAIGKMLDECLVFSALFPGVVTTLYRCLESIVIFSILWDRFDKTVRYEGETFRCRGLKLWTDSLRRRRSQPQSYKDMLRLDLAS